MDIVLAEVDGWRRTHAFDMPGPVCARALGLVLQSFRANPEGLNFEIDMQGIDLHLINRTVRGDYEELLEIKLRRCNTQAVDEALELLRGAAAPFSNHERLILHRKPMFRALSDPYRVSGSMLERTG